MGVQPVIVQFYKYPKTLHWGFEGAVLGEDEWGTWVAAPAGTRHWKGEGEVRFAEGRAVLMAPHEGWWHLHYNGDERVNYRLFIDICTPPEVSDGRIEMVDLDLDVGLTQAGEVVIEDEDEFAVHQVELGYSAEMILRAREATDHIADMLRRREEPFFDVAETWLARVV